MRIHLVWFKHFCLVQTLAQWQCRENSIRKCQNSLFKLCVVDSMKVGSIQWKQYIKYCGRMFILSFAYKPTDQRAQSLNKSPYLEIPWTVSYVLSSAVLFYISLIHQTILTYKFCVPFKQFCSVYSTEITNSSVVN